MILKPADAFSRPKGRVVDQFYFFRFVAGTETEYVAF